MQIGRIDDNYFQGKGEPTKTMTPQPQDLNSEKNRDLLELARQIKEAGDVEIPSRYELAPFKTELLKRLNSKRGDKKERMSEQSDEVQSRPMAASKFSYVLPALVIVVIVALLGWLVLSKIGSQQGIEQLKTVASIDIDLGAAVVNSGDGWRSMAQGAELHVGDSIRTDEGGRAVVVFDGGNELRLDSATTVVIDGFNDENALVSLSEGRAYSRVVDHSRLYALVANDIRFEADGTAFGAQSSDSFVKIVTVEDNVDALSGGEPIVSIHEGEVFEFLSASDFREIELDKLAMQGGWWDWNLEEDKRLNVALGILGDFEPPELIVESPADNSTTTDEKIKVIGKTESEAEVFINGKVVDINDGRFESEVALELGENIIKVRAVDHSKNKNDLSIKVKRQEREREEEVKDVRSCNPAVTLNAIAFAGKQAAFSWTKSCASNVSYKLAASRHTSSPGYPENVVWQTNDRNKTAVTLQFEHSGKWYVRIVAITPDGKKYYSNVEWFVIEEGESELDMSVILREPEVLPYGVKFRWNRNLDPRFDDNFKYYKLIATKDFDDPKYPRDILWYSTTPNTISVTYPLRSGTWKARIVVIDKNGNAYYSNKVTVRVIRPIGPPIK